LRDEVDSKDEIVRVCKFHAMVVCKMYRCNLLFLRISILEGREYRDGGGNEISYYKLYRAKLKAYYSAA
jgi:hypothetical protein